MPLNVWPLRFPCFIFFVDGSDAEGLAAEPDKVETCPRLFLLLAVAEDVPMDSDDAAVLSTCLRAVATDMASADAWIHALLQLSMCAMNAFFSPLTEPAEVHALCVLNQYDNNQNK
jgi:hypothetical protein